MLRARGKMGAERGSWGGGDEGGGRARVVVHSSHSRAGNEKLRGMYV